MDVGLGLKLADRVAEIRDANGLLKQSIVKVKEQHQEALTFIRITGDEGKQYM